ncbi:hypothetical protein KJ657_01155 [Patescibacteria group bacterium]|nr:hypothetical protein [Patescibacteria group bacterium]
MTETPKKAPEPTGRLAEFFKEFIKEYKGGKGFFEAFLAGLKASVSTKLRALKNEVGQQKEPGQEEGPPEAVAEGPEAEETEPSQNKSGKKPASAPLSAEMQKFRKGKLFASIAETFPDVEVQSKLIPLSTAISKPNPGAAGWTKESTDNWDWKKVGNTDEDMKKGMYRIEAIREPNGYTRSGTDKVPSDIKPKLTKIAVALLHDPRMPLFKGIAMKVDGVEVMMVKEIHMHPRGTASTYLCQPHTGVSYIMKKN